GINKDLGFSDEDRIENIRRIGELSKLFIDAGIIVLSAFISPFRSDRLAARQLVEPDEFIEVFVDTRLDICEQRDPKGLYQKAREGKIAEFTGISSPYEAPTKPEIHLDTSKYDVEQSVQKIINYLEQKGYLNA
ncbi:adenylyl-sulfate kinase, partial [Sulfuricurvum sp.]|uniref:adenylyl-sulfate kinase n=1 Tax=Sulfuricurvum sp. TaxID=2025608 RepID=UPI002610F98C